MSDDRNRMTASASKRPLNRLFLLSARATEALRTSCNRKRAEGFDVNDFLRGEFFVLVSDMLLQRCFDCEVQSVQMPWTSRPVAKKFNVEQCVLP
jgi:hypothetical protein